jgi:hypothetical protein
VKQNDKNKQFRIVNFIVFDWVAGKDDVAVSPVDTTKIFDI